MDELTAADPVPVRVDISDWLEIEVPATAVLEPDSMARNAEVRELSLDPEFDLTN